MNWLFYSIASAFFAALTAILAKIGIKNVDSNLATAIRTVVILVFAWAVIFFQGNSVKLGQISKFSLLFIVLSGIATALSWIFYFKALQIGDASKVAPIDKLSLVLTLVFAFIFLKEKITLQVLSGTVLMTLGAILIALAK